MAPAKDATAVDFDLLREVEPGDVVQVHFTEDSVGAVGYLVNMVQAAIITSPHMTILLAIQASHDWGGARNRYVEFSPTTTFDAVWLTQRLTGSIDKLEVMSRTRALVDTSVLDEPNASVRYRFRPDSVDGVIDLLTLHDMGVVELGNADDLRYIAEVKEWILPRSRGGHFTNRLAGDIEVESREHFIATVAPHLEFLRV